MIALQRRVYWGILLLWILLVLSLQWWNHSEPESGVLLTAMFLSLGVIVLGMLLRIWNWWTGVAELDTVVAMAWCLSLGQVIAWPCMLFSNSWLVSGHLAAGVFGAWLVAGLLYWAWPQWAVAAFSPPPIHPPGIGEPARFTEQLSDRRRSRITALAWFTLGLFGALCLAFAIASIASFLRGPIVGHNELFFPVYAMDQFLVNLAGGSTIMIIGWTTATVLRWRDAARALVWGIIAGTTLFGLMFALD